MSTKNKETLFQSVPVGRIEYLGSNGNVGEVVEYIDEMEFIRDILEENYYGAPMLIKVYRHDDGSTIALDFVDGLDPPPQGFEIIDSPYSTFAKDMRVFDLTNMPVERESDSETTKKKARVEHVR